MVQAEITYLVSYGCIEPRHSEALWLRSSHLRLGPSGCVHYDIVHELHDDSSTISDVLSESLVICVLLSQLVLEFQKSCCRLASVVTQTNLTMHLDSHGSDLEVVNQFAALIVHVDHACLRRLFVALTHDVTLSIHTN